jgi:hypothetical protein
MTIMYEKMVDNLTLKSLNNIRPDMLLHLLQRFVVNMLHKFPEFLDSLEIIFYWTKLGAVMVMIVWSLDLQDLQLLMQLSACNC